MKKLLLSLALLSVAFSASAAKKKESPRVLEFNVEKVDGKVVWSPSRVEVLPGESVVFKVNYKLEGGMDFHGFSIPALNISDKVERNKALSLAKTIPADLKEGEYPVTCQFHPAHVAATLLVKKVEPQAEAKSK